MKPVILWAIDGTLVKSSASKQDEYAAAFEHVLQQGPPRNESWSRRADGEILPAMVRSLSVPFTPELLGQLIEALDEITEAELKEHRLEATPGCAEALIELRQRGFRNAVITGNTPRRAYLKLTSADILNLIDFYLGFFGDSPSDRTQLVGNAVVALRQDSTLRLVALVGDTPNDIRAAQAYWVPVVAVVTGKFSIPVLKNHSPNVVINDLAGLIDSFSALDREESSAC